MAGRIWVVTEESNASPLAYWSTPAWADRYRNLLVERYGLGKTLALHGKPIAQNAGAWSLGLGPVVVERSIDEPLESLPGVWCVKVDESMRMISCHFSTQYTMQKRAEHYRLGIHATVECYGTTPHAALDRARKEMASYLGKNSAWR